MTRADGPADTRMMGIVHGALRRDLLRAREAVGNPPYPRGRQRRALGEHVVWLMDFLHGHHTGEDEGLWPAVRERDPSAGALLDSLEQDHRRIEPAATALRAAAERYAATTDDDDRAALVTALDDLGEVLVPPPRPRGRGGDAGGVARLTRAEWDAIEQEHHVRPKSVTRARLRGALAARRPRPRGARRGGPHRAGAGPGGAAARVPAPLPAALRGRVAARPRRAHGARGVSTDQAPARRPYRSPRRQQQAAETRAAVVGAATRLFGERGWAATGMRDVAREAGVSVETVYASFRTKADLLMAAIDVAVVGDAAPVPLEERPQFTGLGHGTRADRARAAADLAADIHRRTVGVNLALREAAASDPALDGLMRRREEGRRHNVADAAALVAGREVSPEVVDGLWAVVDVGNYRLLTDLRGWTARAVRRVAGRQHRATPRRPGGG